MAEQETLRVDRIIGAFGLVCLAILMLFAVGEIIAVGHTFLDKWLFTPQAEASLVRRLDAVDRTLAKHPGIAKFTIGNGADAIRIQFADPHPAGDH